MNRLAPDRLRLKAAFQRIGGEVDEMEERLGRLDAAREALSLRQAETGPTEFRAKTAKRNRPQALEITRNRETADSPPPMISGAQGSPCEAFRFAGRNESSTHASRKSGVKAQPSH
jgi:hypothetical protein